MCLIVLKILYTNRNLFNFSCFIFPSCLSNQNICSLTAGLLSRKTKKKKTEFSSRCVPLNKIRDPTSVCFATQEYRTKFHCPLMFCFMATSTGDVTSSYFTFQHVLPKAKDLRTQFAIRRVKAEKGSVLCHKTQEEKHGESVKRVLLEVFSAEMMVKRPRSQCAPLNGLFLEFGNTFEVLSKAESNIFA